MRGWCSSRDVDVVVVPLQKAPLIEVEGLLGRVRRDALRERKGVSGCGDITYFHDGRGHAETQLAPGDRGGSPITPSPILSYLPLASLPQRSRPFAQRFAFYVRSNSAMTSSPSRMISLTIWAAGLMSFTRLHDSPAQSGA